MYWRKTMNETLPLTMPDELVAAQMADLFSALGDASRIRIIALLAEREMSVGDLAEQVGLSHSAVSHHLRHLRQMRLVRTRKEGRYVFYHLDDEHISDLFRCGLEHVLHG
jgi:DNA-binding transcriptional ArsR family regulator